MKEDKQVKAVRRLMKHDRTLRVTIKMIDWMLDSETHPDNLRRNPDLIKALDKVKRAIDDVRIENLSTLKAIHFKPQLSHPRIHSPVCGGRT